MKSNIVRIAAVIALLAAITFGTSLFRQTGHVVWALEDSIVAVSRYYAVVMEGWETERTWLENGSSQRQPSKSWAVANADQTRIEKFRSELAGVPMLVTDGKKTWRYDPHANVVHVENRPYTASEIWCGSRFLEQLQRGRDKGVFNQWNVSYGKDPATDRDRAVLTFAMPNGPPSPRSLEITFDLETKLPISLKQWENPNWEDPADLIIERITYFESLPDNLFQMDATIGAKFIGE